MDNWFTVDQVDAFTYIISEYRHWEETHCYLLIGNESSLLIDTGLGISNIYEEVRKLTDKPITAVATHIHWDHIGGLKYFPDFYVHIDEVDWLNGKFPLPKEVVKEMVVNRCDLPSGFDINSYEIFQGIPTKIISDCDIINLGNRQIEVLHTPGHAPGHLCFWERNTGYLFTGDLVYKDTLFANYPSTDPQEYLVSLKRILALPTKRIFPGHHSLDIQPEILHRIKEELESLNIDGKLHHGSGIFNFGDWGISL
ncbi:MAG: MBL fold metallo-hydrolase [Longicatena sp.]